jgi:regulator of RNase E activity RraA
MIGSRCNPSAALELVRPGDVIVVDRGGDISRALVGDIIMTIASGLCERGRDQGCRLDLPV